VARTAVVWTILLVAGCAASREPRAERQAIPARWVAETDGFDPDWADFMFDALAFSTPTDGWIVGDRFLLHLIDGGMTVTFMKPTRIVLVGLDFAAPNDGWAWGFTRTPRGPVGVFRRYRNAGWEPIDATGIDWPAWFVTMVQSAPSGEVWAAISTAAEHEPAASPETQPRHALLRRQADRWEIDPTVQALGPGWAFSDACFGAGDEGWFVGADLAASGGRRPLAVRRLRGAWEQAGLPQMASPRATLERVACLPDGRAFAIGTVGGDRDHRGHPVLLRYDGAWHEVPLPDAFLEASVGALAAVSDTEVWLAVSEVDTTRPPRAAFLHWVAGEWSVAPPPALPEGRVGGYVLTDLQFVSASEGWATANDYDGPGIVRGLIFHYRDGVWRNRNWSWHLWDMPGFGMFGD